MKTVPAVPVVEESKQSDRKTFSSALKKSSRVGFFTKCAGNRPSRADRFPSASPSSPPFAGSPTSNGRPARSRKAAIVEIRSGLGNDAQRRNFELAAREDVFNVLLFEGRRQMACLATRPHEHLITALGRRRRAGGRRSIGVQIGIWRIVQRPDVGFQGAQCSGRRLRSLHSVDDDAAHIGL